MLVVDDDDGVRKLLHAIFASEFEVTFAENARQGVAAIAVGAYDIVLSDYSMPEGSGLDVLRAAHKFLPSARLALVSSNPPQEVREEAVGMGAAISPKPFQPIELRELIDGLVIREFAAPRLAPKPFASRTPHDIKELNAEGWWSISECVRCRMTLVYLHFGVDVVSIYPTVPSDFCVA